MLGIAYWRRIVLTLAVAMASADSASALWPEDHADAQEFAPLLWLATDERLYPILPHAFAFDGIDNNGNGLLDLMDPDEVRMGELDVSQSSALVEQLQGIEFLVPFTASTAAIDKAESDLAYAQAWQQQVQIDQQVMVSGNIHDDLRRAFSTAQVRLSDVVMVAPDDTIPGSHVNRGPWMVTEYLHRGDLEAETTRRYLVAGRAHQVLVAELAFLGCRFVRGHLQAEYGLWRFEGTRADSTTAVVYLRDEAENRTVGVYGSETREYSAKLVKKGDYLQVERKSKMPPPRVCYAHSEDTRCGLTVWQYWLYYLFDIGTGPHKHDSELVVVFTDPLHQVASVVGTGHTAASANNILVRDRNASLTMQRPQSLPKHMPILVELGKHASSPDRAFNGQFDVGMDANVFYSDVWGSRDILAAFGKINLKRMDAAYSFPRDYTTLIVEKKWYDEAHWEPGDGAAAADSKYKDTFTATDEANLAKMRSSAGSKFGGGYDQYELFPVAYMAELEEQLAAAQDSEPSRAELTKWLQTHADVFWGRGKAPRKVEISAEAFTQMLLWAKNKDDKQDMWRHASYRNPNDVFKLWLFPRLAGCFTGWHQAGNFGSRFGLQFADVSLGGNKLLGLIPIPRLELYREATIEFYAELDHRWRLGDVGYVYNKFRGSHGGWYLGLARGGGLDRRPNPVITCGVVPFSWDMQNWLSWPRHTQLAFRAGLRAELATRQKPWRLDPIQLQIGVQLTFPALAPRHPLDTASGTVGGSNSCVLPSRCSCRTSD